VTDLAHPTNSATAVASIAPIVLPAPHRASDLQLRVSAPVTGDGLPIILLSHGLGQSNNLSSLNGYAPLVNLWAAQGFVVIQPTHLDSKSRGLQPGDPQLTCSWRTRAEDMSFILDHLDDIEATISHLRGRMAREKVAVAGHSMGGHTAGLLLGVRLIDPQDGTEVDLTDSRIVAGVLLAAPGRGGDVLTPFAAEHLPFLQNTNFSTMTSPALVVNGDEDTSDFLNVEGPAWLADAYRLAPGPKSLLTLFGAGHILGGISGYDAAEATDENPERVRVVGAMTGAYLKTQLGIDHGAWPKAQRNFAAAVDPFGKLESK
jgi:predicted dienelactone hydrolase